MPLFRIYQSMFRMDILGHKNAIREPCIEQSLHLVDPLSVARKINLHGDLVVRVFDPEEVKLAIDPRLGELDEVVVLLDRSWKKKSSLLKCRLDIGFNILSR